MDNNQKNMLIRLKDFIDRFLIYIVITLVIVVLALFLLPNHEEQKYVDSYLTLTLKGKSNMKIIKGEPYYESGYYAYDSREGDITSRVTVEGSVDTNVIGKYILKYRVANNSGKISEAIRTLEIIPDLSDIKINIDYEPKSLTNTDVVINVSVSGDGYEFLLPPTGKVTQENYYSYTATENDDYLFTFNL